MKSSVLKLAVVLLLIVPTAASVEEWNIQDLEAPHSLDQIDRNQNTVQIVRILDSQDRPVDPERIDESQAELNFKYDYESFDYQELEANYMGDGYWYTIFNATKEQNHNIEYEILDRSPSGGQINVTEVLDDGDLGVEIIGDLNDKYKTTDRVFVEADVIDESTGDVANGQNTDVNAYWTDGDQIYNMVELGQQSNGHYTNLISVPEEYNQTFALHVNATSSTVSNGYGSESDIITTYPSKLARYEEISTSSTGCNNESFFTACERGADIDVGFNATVFPATSARFEVFLESDYGGWQRIENIDMNEENGLWTADFEFPDVDTSEYGSNVVMRTNASIENTHFQLTRNITADSFTIEDRGEPTTYPGRTYTLEIAYVKEHSLRPLNETRITDGYVEVENPNGTLLENVTLSDFTYSDGEGLFRADIDIPIEADEGSYPVNMHGQNIYGETKSKDSGFNVDDAQASFDTLDSVSFEVNKSGTYTENIPIESTISEDRTLEFYTEGDISDITTVNDGGSIDLPASESITPSASFNMDSVTNLTGEIIISDSIANYNKTVDVEIQEPECVDRSGDLCLLNDDDWLNITSYRVGYETRNVTLLNFGHDEPLVEASGSGDISPYLQTSPSTFDLADSQVVELNYSVEDDGDFIGDITFNTNNRALNLRTKLSSEADREDPGITGPVSINFGEVPEGETVQETIYINNTGELDIEDLSVDSSTFEASVGSSTIAAGTNKTFDLEISNVESSYGTVEISGSTSKGEVSTTVTVQGTVQTRRDVSQLESRISDLRGQADTTNTETRLDNLENQISDIEDMYDEGDYQEANSEYDSVSSELNQLETELSSNTGTGTGTGGINDTGSTDPGDDGGGGPSILVPIVVVVFVLLLVGFVFYTSYVPEEGDPLYDLMG